MFEWYNLVPLYLMLFKQFNNFMIGHLLCAEDYLNNTIPFKTRIVTPDLWPH